MNILAYKFGINVIIVLIFMYLFIYLLSSRAVAV